MIGDAQHHVVLARLARRAPASSGAARSARRPRRAAGGGSSSETNSPPSPRPDQVRADERRGDRGVLVGARARRVLRTATRQPQQVAVRLGRQRSLARVSGCRRRTIRPTVQRRRRRLPDDLDGLRLPGTAAGVDGRTGRTPTSRSTASSQVSHDPAAVTSSRRPRTAVAVGALDRAALQLQEPHDERQRRRPVRLRPGTASPVGLLAEPAAAAPAARAPRTASGPGSSSTSPGTGRAGSPRRAPRRRRRGPGSSRVSSWRPASSRGEQRRHGLVPARAAVCRAVAGERGEGVAVEPQPAGCPGSAARIRSRHTATGMS